VLKLRSKDKEKGKRRRKSSRKKNRSEKVRDRFRIRDLEQYGFTNAALQNMFGEEMDSLLSLIEEVQTIVDEYDLEIIHKVPSLNAMWERYQYSEKILNEMNQKVKEISEMSNQPKERNEVSYIPPSKIIDESVLNQKRKMIVEEIIAKEKSYYEALKIIQEEFEIPLNESDLISPQDPKIIFTGLEEIIQIHENLLSKLIEGKDNIGSIFLSVGEKFKEYISYLNNYSNSSYLIRKEMKKKPFAKFIESKVRLPRCQGNDMASFMIRPIQRVPQYILLLNDLSQKTPMSHPDYAPLQQAIELIKSVADFMNTKTKKF